MTFGKGVVEPNELISLVALYTLHYLTKQACFILISYAVEKSFLHSSHLIKISST